jgi:hypothetical protein
MTRPAEKLVKAAYRVTGYLVGRPHFKICYNTPAYPELRNRIYAACDASFADARLIRKSQRGHLIFYNSGPIIWKSNRQRTIALSTTEAELDSFVSCVRSVLHTMRTLESMGSPQHGVNIFEDNRCTTVYVQNNMSPGNSRPCQERPSLDVLLVENALNPDDILPPIAQNEGEC